jgi:uncharacterized protein
MKAAQDRAWRFVHPDFDVGATNIGSASQVQIFSGLKLSIRGGIEMVSDTQAVRQALLLLLSTVPGERVMRPDYGCRLHSLMFSPNDNTTAGLAIHYVRRAIERWEPRVQISHLDTEINPEQPELLEIILGYRVRLTQRVDELRFAMNLEGEAF